MTTTPNLALPYLDAAQAQKHVTMNEALRRLDALVMLTIADRDLAAPPASPIEGARYVVAAAPSGAWSGQAGAIAAWQDGTWAFIAPRAGFLAYVADEAALLVWDGAAWQSIGSGPSSELQNLTRLGLGTSADAVNPFAAKLNNALWAAKTTAEGGDGALRYKMSKETAAATLSLLMQTNYSGRAEIGLTGDDDLHIKTSPDGSTWTDALLIDKSTGATKINAAFFLTGDLSPALITADQNDFNPTGLATASVVRIGSDAARAITGLAGGGDGRLLTLVNAGSFTITLNGQNASSSAANRFAIGADLAIAPNQAVSLLYDAVASRWRALGIPGAGGGGGAPSDAPYITASANGTLGAERVLTNTATVTWDFATAGQAKANIVGCNRGAPDVIIEDRKSSGTGGGTFTATGDYEPRDLNTVVYDPNGIASLSSGQITLAAGTYYIEFSAPAFKVDLHRAAIADGATGTRYIIGSNARSDSGGNYAVTHSTGSGVVSSASTLFLKLRHRCATTQATNGFGLPVAFAGEGEVYSRILIWKVS